MGAQQVDCRPEATSQSGYAGIGDKGDLRKEVFMCERGIDGEKIDPTETRVAFDTSLPDLSETTHADESNALHRAVSLQDANMKAGNDVDTGIEREVGYQENMLEWKMPEQKSSVHKDASQRVSESLPDNAQVAPLQGEASDVQEIPDGVGIHSLCPPAAGCKHLEPEPEQASSPPHISLDAGAQLTEDQITTVTGNGSLESYVQVHLPERDRSTMYGVTPRNMQCTFRDLPANEMSSGGAVPAQNLACKRSFMKDLEQLVSWRSSGFLTAKQFEQAKDMILFGREPTEL